MLKSFSFLKDASAKILFLIFIANFFYDDAAVYPIKRVIYSVFIYYSIWEIWNFYYKRQAQEYFFRMRAFYTIYIPLLFLFIVIALAKDMVNPGLNWVTLINNPFALLSVVPIFLFIVGANSEDIEPVFKSLLVVAVVFFIAFAFPYYSKFPYYQGYICANVFIPLFILSNYLKKYRTIIYTLIIVGLVFSQISDYRIIALRILLFLSLFYGFTICKKYGLLKFLIIAFTCFCLYQFIANLKELLTLFKSIVGVKNFDADDTRGFLWEELFEDLKGSEIIFGRGFLGTYFSDYFLMLLTRYKEYADHYERYSIEVGFLELILKGGFFWYVLYIIPILYSSLKGIFKHFKDPLVYAISIFLFTDLLLMFIENIPYFSFQFSLLFFLAGYAIRRMRAIENAEMEMELEKRALSRIEW